jgi:uncharacterized protein YdaU (DUF1376 family)
MHYYRHHIGDFLKDTGHLSNDQMGVYLRMLWKYYLDEKPLKDDCESIAFAMRSDEKTVHLILRHFFVLHEDGWRHNRCDKEIADFHQKKEKAANSANARWNGAKTMRAHIERNTDAHLFDANQEPITNNQKPLNTEPTVLVISPSEKTPSAPISEIVDLYNSRLPMLPRVTVVSDSRKRLVAARWRDVVSSDKLDRAKGLEFFEWFFVHVGKSKFLTGKTKDWKANFEFLFTASKFPRIVEGAYHQEQS